jgi:hypothetical protein
MKTVPEILHILPAHGLVEQKDMEAEAAMSFKTSVINAGEWGVLQ